MSNLRGKKVLLTGATGFIGSHLADRLVRDGAKVRAMVHYNSRGEIGNLRFLEPKTLQKIELRHGNLVDDAFVNDAVSGCEYIFHLGALIAIPFSYTNPKDYVLTNVIGTNNLLNAALKGKIRRFVHTSTSEVFGTAQTRAISETHPIHSQSPYAASKAGADQMVDSYHRSFGLPTTIVRPFNNFGPRQSARAVIPTIISQALFSDRIRVGTTNSVRDFLYVTDTADAYVRAALSAKSIGATYNFGTGKAVTIAEVIETVRRILRVKLPVVVEKARVRPSKSEVMRLLCDWSRARRELGWKPRVSLREGLGETIAWIRRHQGEFRPEQYTR